MRAVYPNRTFVLFLMIVCAAPLISRAQEAATKQRKVHKPTDTVGVVKGVLITFHDFREELKQTLKEHIAEIPHDSVSDTAFTRFVDITWEKMVGSILIDQEIQKRHLALTDAQTIAKIEANPPKELKLD